MNNVGLFAAGKKWSELRWSVIGDKQGVEGYATKREALDRIAALKQKGIMATLYDCFPRMAEE